MKICAQVELANGNQSLAHHTVSGAPIGVTHKLQVVQFDGESGFYLIRYGVAGDELTDTLHETVIAALDQAQFEYGVLPAAWDVTSGL